MIYKDHEILARVFVTGSDIYTLTSNGELDKSLDITIDHNDPQVVWYEVAEMEHLSCLRGNLTEIPTVDEAKLRIDAYETENTED